ncbi:MAG: multidrug effflux MFS transporter [Pseudomonadota bacterium]
MITLGLMTAAAAISIDLSLPAIPAMVDTLSTTLSRTQQIVGIFMIGMALGQIPSGLAADRFGRMPTLYTGLSLFVIAATVAAMANSIDVMLAARFVQGMGAATAIVVSRAMVRDVSSGRDAARLMSLMTMIFTAAPVIAPSIGALLFVQWGWRAPFVGIAICGYIIFIGVRMNLVETHTADASEHPLRQLIGSFHEFFSHRQSVFAFLLLITVPAGFMSIIAISAALTTQIYGFTEQQFGLIFACAGLSILAGATVNRWLVTRFDPIQLVSIGVLTIFIACGQLAYMAWANEAPFVWLWGCICMYMFAIALLIANATVVALDPLPRIAGVASSIIGTSQNVMGATGALVAAVIYDGSVRNALTIIASVGVAITLVFLARPLICPGKIVHHPDELARD